jgi:hypothetical protein
MRRGRIDEAYHAARLDARHAAGKAALELDPRRLHTVVTMAVHHIHDRA